jgi:nucleoside-diphosphate-sugar epimerase
MPLDAYSQQPISKSQLLEVMQAEFGLRHKIVPRIEAPNATGIKIAYYSTDRRAAALGYRPAYSSRSGIVKEVKAMLADRS